MGGSLKNSLFTVTFSFLFIVMASPGGALVAAGQQESSSIPSLGQAQGLIQQGKFKEAVEALGKITAAHPKNPGAWLLLGFALQKTGQLDRALEANLKAADFASVAPQANYNAACICALKGEKDRAFTFLEKVKASGKVDMNQIRADSDLKSLRDDPRFQKLLPSSADFADPFVEKVRIIHEWDGESAGGQFGWIARNVGDVDGDGSNDLATSAPSLTTDGPNAGKIYVYSGKSGALLWEKSGHAKDQLGLGIEAAGDTNKDGIPDVIAGAPGRDEAYVYSGKDGTLLLTLKGENKGDFFGREVKDLGDVNGDGHDDVFVGAPRAATKGKGAGRAYIFSGSDGTVLLKLDGEAAGDGFGSAAAGLFDGKFSFLVIGAAQGGPDHKGRVSVYTGWKPKLKFTINSDDTGFRLGAMFVSVVGDVDADGTPDIYASDWPNTAKGRTTGRIYVYSGADGHKLYTFTGENAGDGFGIGPADAGDVNGDGHADLIVGAWRFSGAAPVGGKAYLYSGKDGSLLRAYTCKVQGDTFGFDATGMGDVDGDGSIDFLITSAWSSIHGYRSGRMFLISGEGIKKP